MTGLEDLMDLSPRVIKLTRLTPANIEAIHEALRLVPLPAGEVTVGKTIVTFTGGHPKHWAKQAKNALYKSDPAFARGFHFSAFHAVVRKLDRAWEEQ